MLRKIIKLMYDICDVCYRPGGGHYPDCPFYGK